MFVCDKNFSCCDYQYADKIKDLDADAQTCQHLIEVSPVIHAHWIEETEQIKSIAMMYTVVKFYRCSECGRKEHNKEPYCNCGARMDGE